jgi:hypothetical protein
MRLRHACVFLCATLSVSAAQPLLLQPGEWTDAPAILRSSTVALEVPVVHVTDKPVPSPSGDPHDYVSFEAKAGAEEADRGDLARLEQFAATVEVLAVAAVKSGNQAFARRAGDWLRAWFVEPATRMNPSLDFAGVRPGSDGRGSARGVIEGRALLRVVDAIRILEGSGALSDDDELAVRAWLADYYNWLATSERGKAAAKERDHHGTWYVLQALALATHLETGSDVHRLCVAAKHLVVMQGGGDGRQPREFAHADGLSASILNLEGHMQLAVLAAQAHIDLWNYAPESGRGLKDALDYLRPFNANPARWPHKQDTAVAPGSLDRVLALAKRLDESVARE